MLAGFATWWLARIAELLPDRLRRLAAGSRNGIVAEADIQGNVIAWVLRNGRRDPINLGAAARTHGRAMVLLRPPPDTVLLTHHIVPSTAKRDMPQLLRHELARITPFQTEDLFWRWDAYPRPADRGRTDVTLTMVPRSAVAPALDTLGSAGLKADFIETEFGLLPISENRGTGPALVRGLAYGCAALAVVALTLPVLLQEVALYRVEAAITELKPAVSRVEALRRDIAAGDAGRDILAREIQRTGDVLQILATITRILPDDTYLTDFALRERQLTISGRSASAPRLITGLSADPSIGNAAFAAPVTRIQGASDDAFSIKAEIAP